MDFKKLRIANDMKFELDRLKNTISKAKEKNHPSFELSVIENGGQKYMGMPSFVEPYIMKAIQQAYDDKIKEFENL